MNFNFDVTHQIIDFENCFDVKRIVFFFLGSKRLYLSDFPTFRENMCYLET